MAGATSSSQCRHRQPAHPPDGDASGRPGRGCRHLQPDVDSIGVVCAHGQPLVDYAAKLAGTMRMYLRFLVAEGAVSEALTAAVPTAPKWSLSPLPKHIPAADIDRTISSCGDHPAGIRNRAVLLLLARLALRAGDIIALRIGDIDWIGPRSASRESHCGQPRCHCLRMSVMPFIGTSLRHVPGSTVCRSGNRKCFSAALHPIGHSAPPVP